jgi:hypothetical protein
MAAKAMGQSPAGLFGFSHMLGGYAGGQAEYLRVRPTLGRSRFRTASPTNRRFSCRISSRPAIWRPLTPR